MAIIMAQCCVVLFNFWEASVVDPGAPLYEEFLNLLDIYSIWNLFVSKFSSILNKCIPLDIPKPKESLFLNTAALRLKNRKCS